MSHSPAIGLLLSGWFDPATSVVRRTHDLLGRVQLAAETGYSSIWVGQHILAEPWPMLDTTAFLGRLSGVTGDMEIGGVYLLPLANPVRLAEALYSLDVLSGGRFVLAAAQGWRQEEFRMLGVPIEQRARRMVETLDIMRALWNQTEPVEYRGRYLSLSGARHAATPVREGGIPVWIGASSRVGVRRAVARADAWLGSSHTPMPLLRELVEEYDLAVADQPARPRRRPLFRHCMVAESEAEALSHLRAGLEGYYGAFESWGLFSDVIGSAETAGDVARLSDGRAIIGDPASCARQLREYVDLGFDEFIFQMGLPGVDEDAVRRSVELMAHEVLPQLVGAAR